MFTLKMIFHCKSLVYVEEPQSEDPDRLAKCVLLKTIFY
jgi:hypothetical protein